MDKLDSAICSIIPQNDEMQKLVSVNELEVEEQIISEVGWSHSINLSQKCRHNYKQ